MDDAGKRMNPHLLYREIVDAAIATDVGRREYVKLGMAAAIGTSALATTPQVSATKSTVASLSIVALSPLASYEFTVSDEVNAVDTAEYDTSGNISGTNAEGTLGALPHEYTISGDICDIRTDGNLLFALDGNLTDPAYFGPEGTLHLRNAEEPTNYSVTVTGNITPRRTNSSESGSVISGHNAEGTLRGETHAYRYSGELANCKIDGTASLFVNPPANSG